MPSRIIKESICYSDDLDRLTSFAETVFYRLLVRVDDYGRIDARPNFLKSMLFATKNGVSEKNVSEAVAQMASLGLVRLYEVDGKPFLCLPKWHLHQRIRDSKAKYPEPPQKTEDFEDSPQVAAGRGELPPESKPNPNPIYIDENSDEFVAETEKAKEKAFEFDGDEVFEKSYRYYPKKEGKSAGKAHYISYLTNGRTVKGQPKLRYNHFQIGIAIKKFSEDMTEREFEFIKEYSTFMNKTVIDYIEKTTDIYENFMLKNYGENWRKIKFRYKFKGVAET
jgi:hypothetical protein